MASKNFNLDVLIQGVLSATNIVNSSGDFLTIDGANVFNRRTASEVVQDLPITALDVAVTPSGNLTSTDVQAALEELQTDIDNINAEPIGNIVQGSGLTLTGTLLDRLTGTGNVTFALSTATQNSLTLADTSIQPGDNVSELVNDAGYELQSNKGVSNGYTPLDAAGKVPLQYLPDTLLVWRGIWDASTNTPTLADGTGTTGDTYRVTGAPAPGVTVDLGSGPIHFQNGDYVIYDGAVWQKSDGTDAVTLVNGLQGVVQLDLGFNSGTGDITITGGTAPINLDSRYYTETETNALLANKADDTDVIHKTGAETKNGQLTIFTSTLQPFFVVTTQGGGPSIGLTNASATHYLGKTSGNQLTWGTSTTPGNNALIELQSNKVTDFTTLNNTLYPTTQAVADYVASQTPTAQTLTFTDEVSNLTISDGNTVKLTSLGLSGNTNGDRTLTDVGNSWMKPIIWGAGQTGWPFSIGQGIEVMRRAAVNSYGGFQLFQRNLTTEAPLTYKQKFTGDLTSWGPERTIWSDYNLADPATETWVNSQGFLTSPSTLQDVTTEGYTTDTRLVVTEDNGAAIDGLNMYLNDQLDEVFIEKRTGGGSNVAGMLNIRNDNTTLLGGGAGVNSQLQLIPEVAGGSGQAGAVFNTRVEGSSAQKTNEFLTGGTNMGYGLNWNQSQFRVDWGETEVVGLDTFHYIPINQNEVLSLGHILTSGTPSLFVYRGANGGQVIGQSGAYSGYGSNIEVSATDTYSVWSIRATQTSPSAIRGLSADDTDPGISVADSRDNIGLIGVSDYSGTVNSLAYAQQSYVDNAVNPATSEWQNITLGGGATATTARCRKKGNVVEIQIEALVQGGSGTVVLPSGYRPTGIIHFVTGAMAPVADVQISPMSIDTGGNILVINTNDKSEEVTMTYQFTIM